MWTLKRISIVVWCCAYLPSLCQLAADDPPAKRETAVTSDREKLLAERQRFLDETNKQAVAGKYDEAIKNANLYDAVLRQLAKLPDLRSAANNDRIEILTNVATWQWSGGLIADALQTSDQRLQVAETEFGEKHWQSKSARFQQDYFRKLAAANDTTRQRMLQLEQQTNEASAMGDYREAIAKADTLKDIEAKVLGVEHPFYANSLANIAVYCLQIRDYERANEGWQAAFTIRRKAYGDAHPEVLACYDGMASIARQQRKWGVAHGHYDRAAAHRRKLFDTINPSDPAVWLDDFVTDSRQQYVIIGDVKWETDKLILSRDASLGREVELGVAWEGRFDLAFPPAPSNDRFEMARFQFALVGDSFSYALVWKSLEIEGKAGTLLQFVEITPKPKGFAGLFVDEKVKVLREQSWPHDPSGRWSLRWNCGLFQVQHGEHAVFDAYISRRFTDCSAWDLCSNLTALSVTQLRLHGMARQVFSEEVNSQLTQALKDNEKVLQLDQERKHAEAATIAERVLEARLRLLGEDHPYTGISLKNLGRQHKLQGNSAAAAPLFRRALKVYESTLGPDHPITASVLADVAEPYYARMDFAAAEPLVQRALAINEKTLGPEHADTAISLNNLAQLYRFWGNYATAEPLFVRALKINEQVHGLNHPATAHALDVLAELYYTQANYPAAEPLFLRALKIREHVIGPNDPATATSLDHLAELYRSQAKYADAKPLYLRSLEIREKALGPNDSATAISLNNLAMWHQDQWRYADAEPLFLRALQIQKKAFGSDHPSTAHGLTNLGLLYQLQGKYSDAESLYLQALAIREKSPGPNHPDTANSLNNLGLLYQDEGKYAAAEPLYLRALKIRENSFGTEHELTANSINNLGVLYHKQGKYADAEPLFSRALNIHEKIFGPAHPRTIECYHARSLRYLVSGDYEASESIAKKTMEICATSLGPDNPLTATSLIRLAEVFRAYGNYPAAESRLQQALKIIEEAFGAHHPTTAIGLVHLAELQSSQGKYSEAVTLQQRALKIREGVFGLDHPDTAESLTGLATLSYTYKGNYADAERLLRRALKIHESTLGPDHPKTATSLNNLAQVYAAQANNAAAEPLLLHAVSVIEKTLGSDHPELAITLANLADLYQSQGDFTAAESLQRRALRISEAKHGTEHPKTAWCLVCIARLYELEKNFDDAESLVRRALKIFETMLGPDHPSTALCLNNLAAICEAQEKFADAESLYERALKIREKELGPRHPDVAHGLSNLAAFCWKTGEISRARSLMARAWEIQLEHLSQTAVVQTERQQFLMQEQARSFSTWWLTISQSDSQNTNGVYGSMLAWKGLITARQIGVRQDLKNDPLFNDFRNVTQQLSTISLNPPLPPSDQKAREFWQTREPELRQQWQAEKSRLESEHERLEKELAAKSENFRDHQMKRPASLQNLMATLNKQPHPTALVDLFVNYYWGRPGETSEYRVVAFVVRGDRQVVRVELGAVAPIYQSIGTWRRAIEDDIPSKDVDPDHELQNLRKLLWEPLQPHLIGIKTVLISPDGALAQLPWAALPGKEPGQYLLEEIALAVIPVPQMLPSLLKNERVSGPPTSLLLAGDIDYGGDTGKAKDLVAKREEKQNSEQSRQFDKLTHARSELSSIKSWYEKAQNNGVLKILDRQQATESAFCTLAPEHQWLHIITHGELSPPNLLTPINDAKERQDFGHPLARHPVSSEITITLPASKPIPIDPRLLSYLAFAGVNLPPGEDKDDGRFTAFDVMALDFNKVDTAVLSACESGLGETTSSEGLLGLQRAFQVAGTKTVVASLWKVDDRATEVLMKQFYENVWEKKLPKLEALRQAQIYVLNNLDSLNGESDRTSKPAGAAISRKVPTSPGKSKPVNSTSRVDPKYWAAFVLSGDWR